MEKETHINIEKTKSIEETLWQAADKLRDSVEPSEYKHVVLGLIFLKFASDKFQERRKELIDDGMQKYLEMKDFMNFQLHIPSIEKQKEIITEFHTISYRIELN